jgi:hypothetical protein
VNTSTLLSIAEVACFALGVLQLLSIPLCLWKNYRRTALWLPHPKRLWTRYAIAQVLRGGILLALGAIAAPEPGALKLVIAALSIAAFFLSSLIEPKGFDMLPIRYNHLFTRVRTQYQGASELGS